MRQEQADLITTLRLLSAGLLIGGFALPWVIHENGSADPGVAALFLAAYLPLFLIADPLKGLFIIGAYLTAGYLLVNLISIVTHSLGRSSVVILLCAGTGLLTMFTWVPLTRVGAGYWLTLVGIFLSCILEAADQEEA